MRNTIARIAHQYLTAHGFDAVCWGDVHLLHEIAEAAGMPHEAWRTERRVLNALDGSPLFQKSYFRNDRGRGVRRFTVKR